jgi:hypothetical protein
VATAMGAIASAMMTDKKTRLLISTLPGAESNQLLK